MTRKFANLWTSTLNGAINDSVTSLTVTAEGGAPDVPFDARIVAEGANKDEIISVTVKAAAVFTIVRATEAIGDGTQVAQSHASGATIEAVLTAAGLRQVVRDPSSRINAYQLFR